MTSLLRHMCFGGACGLLYSAIMGGGVVTLCWAIGVMLLSYLYKWKAEYPEWQKKILAQKLAKAIEETDKLIENERLKIFKENFEEGKKEYEETINGKKDKKNCDRD